MAAITVRNLPDEVHRALRLRAADHGRSTEAEVREILAMAVKPETRLLMGDAMSALAREARLTNDDVGMLEGRQDKAPAQPWEFE